MALFIGVVSQKGGVGKSTIARMIAREFAAQEWEVLIADMDVSQATSYRWNARRLQAGISPDLNVQQFAAVTQAIGQGSKHDLIVFDGSPAASRETAQIAKACSLVLLPTSESFEDLEPQMNLANELVKNGLSIDAIAFVLCRVGRSSAQLEDAQNYIRRTPYALIDGHIEDKPAWKTALLEGRTLTETQYDSLNSKAAEVVQSIVDKFGALTKEIA